MQKRLDNLFVGIVLGLIMPVVMLFFYYIFTYRYQTSFSGFVAYFSRLNIIVASLSLSCYAANLPLFFLFIWREHYKAGRGVLFATILYTLWVVYEKFLA
jgi:hypothetical protein